MRSLLFLSCCLALAASDIISNRPLSSKIGSLRGPGFTRVYTGFGQSGVYQDFSDYVPDLAVYGLDNQIRSTCLTGLWFYYEQIEYNQSPGTVYWIHGIEYCTDFPLSYAAQTSSLRYAGSPYALNDDCFTLYEGTYFTGSEYYGDGDLLSTLDYMNGDGSSLVITGTSAWTFFSGMDYTGSAVCFYPNTDHDSDSQTGVVIDFGIFPTANLIWIHLAGAVETVESMNGSHDTKPLSSGLFNDLGIADNSFYSAAKGCFSKTIIRATTPVSIKSNSKGAMGYFRNPRK